VLREGVVTVIAVAAVITSGWAGHLDLGWACVHETDEMGTIWEGQERENPAQFLVLEYCAFQVFDPWSHLQQKGTFANGLETQTRRSKWTSVMPKTNAPFID
jgi:hypothetical protein